MSPVTNSLAQLSSPRFPVCSGAISPVSLLCSFSKQQRWRSTPTCFTGGIFKTRRDLLLSRSFYCSSASVWQLPKFSPTNPFSTGHPGDFLRDLEINQPEVSISLDGSWTYRTLTRLLAMPWIGGLKKICVCSIARSSVACRATYGYSAFSALGFMSAVVRGRRSVRNGGVRREERLRKWVSNRPRVDG